MFIVGTIRTDDNEDDDYSDNSNNNDHHHFTAAALMIVGWLVGWLMQSLSFIDTDDMMTMTMTSRGNTTIQRDILNRKGLLN